MESVNTPSRVKRASPLSGPSDHRARKWRVILAVGLCGIIVAGVALVAMISTMSPRESLPITIVRPAEVIRVGGARPDATIRADAVKPSPNPISVPPPQGTVRRMEGISKAFSKQ
jgi:hypothetical protein